MIERRSGRIVAISSLVGRTGMARAGHYAAAKWGVIGLAKSLSLEVAPYGITVNVVLPGGVNTEIVHNPVTYKMLLPDVESPTRDDVMPLSSAASRRRGCSNQRKSPLPCCSWSPMTAGTSAARRSRCPAG